MKIDVQPVRFAPQPDYFRPQLFQSHGGYMVVGSVRAIKNGPHVRKVEVGGKAVFKVNYIAPRAVFYAESPTHFVRGRVVPPDGLIQNHAFNGVFGFVIQFEAVPVEQLDAVVMKRIVRGRNYNAEIRPHVSG